MFKQNENNLDRIIRVIIGVAALFAGLFIFTGILKIISLIIAFLGIFTGLTGICLIYKLLGIKTK